MRRTRAAALCAALVLVVLSGCTEAPTVTRLPETTPTAAQAQPTVASTADLKALKKASGIADCPASDRSVAAVPNGLPDVVVPCLGDGRAVRLAGLRGAPMLVTLWAQWCGPCRAEAPYLAEVSRRAGAKLTVIGADFHDPAPDLALEFARQSGWTYPQLQDPGDAFARLQLTAPPVTLLVRPDGTLAGPPHFGGFTSTQQIVDLVHTQLKVAL